MKVLVIDDDPYVLRTCTEEFSRNGHEVLTAENGKQGFKIFQSQRDSLDVVVIDIRLPDIDGIYLLKELIKIDTKIPKIMFTAYDYRDDFAVWASDAYILKEGNKGYKELVATAEKLHENRKARK